MRTFQLVIVSSFAACLGIAAGCGGNVVVDGGSGGSGGGKTSSNNTGTTATGTTGISVTGTTGTTMTSGGPATASVGPGGGNCSDQSCFVGSDGFCGCEITCSGKLFSTRCQPVAGGALCECNIDGMPVAKCDDKAAICDVFLSCCGAFFGQSGG